MAIVAGCGFRDVKRSSVDCGQRSVGCWHRRSPRYPLHRKREDPEYATQSHEDHMRALASATREAVQQADVRGEQVEAIALDTTGSSVIPVDANMQPLDEYYLWCDHRAKGEAAEITEAARQRRLAGDPVVRRRVFLGVGIFEAAALAAAQSR